VSLSNKHPKVRTRNIKWSNRAALRLPTLSLRRRRRKFIDARDARILLVLVQCRRNVHQHQNKSFQCVMSEEWFQIEHSIVEKEKMQSFPSNVYVIFVKPPSTCSSFFITAAF
jgi:hypothetical protein